MKIMQNQRRLTKALLMLSTDCVRRYKILLKPAFLVEILNQMIHKEHEYGTKILQLNYST